MSNEQSHKSIQQMSTIQLQTLRTTNPTSSRLTPVLDQTAWSVLLIAPPWNHAETKWNVEGGKTSTWQQTPQKTIEGKNIGMHPWTWWDSQRCLFFHDFCRSSWTMKASLLAAPPEGLLPRPRWRCFEPRALAEEMSKKPARSVSSSVFFTCFLMLFASFYSILPVLAVYSQTP